LQHSRVLDHRDIADEQAAPRVDGGAQRGNRREVALRRGSALEDHDRVVGRRDGGPVPPDDRAAHQSGGVVGATVLSASVRLVALQ
jgi:hypothetical protein